MKRRNDEQATVVRLLTGDDLDIVRRIAADSFDREPIQRAALVDLLIERPGQSPQLLLVAEFDDTVIGFAIGSVHEGVGYVDAVAVTRAMRRRGHGARLLNTLHAAVRAEGAQSFAVGGNTRHYAWPGVDLGYSAALALFHTAGYAQTTAIQNMDVALESWIIEPRRVVDDLVTLERARPEQWPALEAFIANRFEEVWRYECELAIHRATPTVFVARRADDILGFACHGIYRTDWFGPIATDDAARGSGVGAALLRLCLDDLARAGIRQAQIGWIGPMAFYARTVDARVGRIFAVLSRAADATRRAP